MDEPCVNKKVCGNGFIFRILYVDNILTIGNYIIYSSQSRFSSSRILFIKDMGEAD